jgi:hypothetical protein
MLSSILAFRTAVIPGLAPVLHALEPVLVSLPRVESGMTGARCRGGFDAPPPAATPARSRP